MPPLRVTVEPHCNDILQAFVHVDGKRRRLAYCRANGEYGIVKGHHGLTDFELDIAKELLEAELGKITEQD